MPVEDDEWPEVQEAPRGATPAPSSSDSADASPSIGPPVEPSSGDQEPHPVTVATKSESDEPAEEPLPEFDPRFRDEFEGLLFLGYLTKTFHWLGHKFFIRTMSVDQVLEVGLIHKEFADTVSDIKAYQAAIVAACVLEVDGKPMPMPLTLQSTDTALQNRFNYVRANWFPPTLDAIYEQYLLLEARVEEVIQAMGEARG